jgi:5-methylcytosine-specific restriction endonuclease McrA
MVTARSVPEWIGATPDTPAPPRVRLRVFERGEGKCHRCTRKIAAGEKWTLEHLVALINGGANAEANLSVTCGWCLPAKNAEDVAEKSRTYRKRSKHLGVRPKHRLIPGSRGTGFHKHMDGTVSRRTT